MLPAFRLGLGDAVPNAIRFKGRFRSMRAININTSLIIIFIIKYHLIKTYKFTHYMYII